MAMQHQDYEISLPVSVFGEEFFFWPLVAFGKNIYLPTFQDKSCVVSHQFKYLKQFACCGSMVKHIKILDEWRDISNHWIFCAQ